MARWVWTSERLTIWHQTSAARSLYLVFSLLSRLSSVTSQLSCFPSLILFSSHIPAATRPPTPTHTHAHPHGCIHKCLAFAVYLKTFHWLHLSPKPEFLFVEVRTGTVSSPGGAVLISPDLVRKFQVHTDSGIFPLSSQICSVASLRNKKKKISFVHRKRLVWMSFVTRNTEKGWR